MIEPEVYHLKKYEFDVAPDVIYTDGFEYSATMSALNKFPNAITVLGAGLNYADPKEVISIAKEVKYIVFSMEFACQVTKMRVDMNNPTHLLNLYKELRGMFPKNEIIVTMQNKGSMFSVDNEIKVMQTMPVTEVDRTGAGDVFDGALIYGLGKGYGLEVCIRLANIAAALSTTKYGAKASIPILSDVISQYESKFGSLEVQQQNVDQGSVSTSTMDSTVQASQNIQNATMPASSQIPEMPLPNQDLNQPFNSSTNNQG